MLEMTIDSIRVSMMNYQHVVILKEKDSDRYLPIWIGPAEADAISVKLQNMDISRPLTHDLLKNTIFALEALSGTSVCRVVVNDLRADTFYAQIIFEFNDGPVPVAVVSITEHATPAEFEKNSPITIIW
jgi:bifunctional DNase/RNase